MRPRTAFALLTILLAAHPAQALWSDDYNKAELWGDEQLPVRQVISCEDGAGGSFVISETGTGDGRRVRVQRISHSGRVLWEPDGRAPALLPGSTYELIPISACPDGKGGVYYTSVEYKGGFHLALTYIGNDGFTARALLDPITLPYDAELVASNDGDAILVSPGGVADPNTLFVVRLDSTLSDIDWNGVYLDPFVFPVTGPDRAECISAVSDGNGGVLIAAARVSAGTSPTEVAFQRITHDGIRAFALGGIVVDDIQTSISSVQVAAAEFDAAYVVIQDAGSLQAHHMTGAGTLDWASPVLLHNTAANIFMETDICSDGVEGLYSVASDGDLHLNHVDLDANEVWGPGGHSVTVTSGIETQPRLVQSDWHGAVLTWINEAPAQPDPVKHLAAMRFDYEGITVWSRAELFGGDGIRDPALLQAVKDLSGGLQLAWTNERIEIGPGWQDVWAMGLDAMGDPPIPRMEYAAPAASEYGQPQAVLLVGDYLDNDTDYRFEHTSGSCAFDLHEPASIDMHAVEGWIHPRQVVNGDYHAQIWDGPVLLAHLPDAYTLAPISPCDTVEDLLISPSPSSIEVQVDDHGDVHLAWIDIDPVTFDEDLFYRKRSAGVWGATVVADSNLGGISVPSMAIDRDATAHIAYLAVPSWLVSEVRYTTIEEGGSPTLVEVWSDGLENRQPHIAIDPTGTTHIVFREGGSPGPIHAKHLYTDGSGFHGPDIIMSDPGLFQIALSPWEGGAVMAYELFLEYPLYRLAYRKLESGAWGEEVELETAAWAGHPRVAWDGQNRILFAWDRYQYVYGGSLLGLRVEERGVLEDLRSLHLPSTDAIAWIASSGPERFHLVSQHLLSTGPADDLIYLRSGNGRTFGPPKLIHSGASPTLGGISAGPADDQVIAYWRQGSTLQAWECNALEPSPTAVDEPPTLTRSRLAAHPNPFNARTLIRFELAEAGRLTLDLFDLRGRKVSRLVEGEFPIGPHEVPLVTGGSTGLDLASGVYLIVLRVDERPEDTAKVVLVK